MADDSYPSDYPLDDGPHWDEPTPRTAAIDARLCDVLLQHVRGDHEWVRTVMAFADDVREHDEIPELLSAVCRYVANMSIECHGVAVTIARLEADLAALRRAAVKEATS
jgi:hypothetical protein